MKKETMIFSVLTVFIVGMTLLTTSCSSSCGTKKVTANGNGVTISPKTPYIQDEETKERLDISEPVEPSIDVPSIDDGIVEPSTIDEDVPTEETDPVEYSYDEDNSKTEDQ